MVMYVMMVVDVMITSSVFNGGGCKMVLMVDVMITSSVFNGDVCNDGGRCNDN